MTQTLETVSSQDLIVDGYLARLLVGLGHEPDPERAQAKRSLLDFLVYEGRGRWQSEPYLELYCNKLEQIADPNDPLDRLMVFMPPRHGKSHIGSIRFPAWYLSQYPDNYIMVTSYGAELAFDFSRDSRQVIEDVDLWPDIRLKSDAKAVKHWKLQGHWGGLIAAGAGGPITGRGAHVAIIDDPFKDWEEAQSEVIRERIWNWFLSTLSTRLAPNGAIVIIQTRWHEDDLSGRLLKQMKEGGEFAENWEVIDFAAIAGEGDVLGRQPGEALSRRYPIDVLLRKKHTMTPYMWNALYQQRPRPEEGDYFKQHWLIDGGDPETVIKAWENKGHYIPRYAAMDFAIEEGQENHWNSISVGAILPGNECMLVERIRFRDDADGIAEEICTAQKHHNILLWGMEEGMIRKAIWPTVKRIAKKQGISINAEFLVPIKDKLARCRTAQGQLRSSMWIFPKGAEWYEEWQEEMLGFPNAEFDDDPDSFGLLARVIADADITYDPFDLNKCAR